MSVAYVIYILPWLENYILAVASFYGLAGDSMHNMNLSLDLIPALGPIVSFKFSLLCITNSNKTVAEVERNAKLV